MLCKINVLKGEIMVFFFFAAAVPLVSVLLCKINVFEGENFGFF